MPSSKIGDLSRAMYDMAKKRGWTVIGMENHWKQLFSGEALMGAVEAVNHGLIAPILFGPEDKSARSPQRRRSILPTTRSSRRRMPRSRRQRPRRWRAPAMLDGKSIETSMGFSAIEGLPMSTRVGEIDAGILLHLMKTDRMDAAALEQLLYKEAGLLGISGVSGDMRELEESQAPEAAEAIDYFVYHIVKFVGAYTAVLGGLDALVFTAGIGENAPLVRAKVCDKLGWLGVTLDAAANDTNGPRISAADCAVSVWVIPTNEELMIARHTLALAIPVPASDADAKQASNAAIGSDVAGRHRERRKGEQT